MLFMTLNMHFVPCSFNQLTFYIAGHSAHFQCQGNPEPLCPVQHCEQEKCIHDSNGSNKTPFMLRSPDGLLSLNWSVQYSRPK
jgi:hypothetical protein